MDKMPPNRLILRLYTGGLAPLLGRLILLLTTTGRKSGLPRATPLQFEQGIMPSVKKPVWNWKQMG